MSKYDKIEHWVRRGRTFAVEVRHHICTLELHGIHRWCVYVFLYPTHAKFREAMEPEFAVCSLPNAPLHRGATFRRTHLNEDGTDIVSVEVGADYNHLHDERFTWMATPEDAREVFADADALFDWAEANSKGDA